ncbi:hypothetical protein [Bergeyella zoohelcum]|uniref:Uncharacterized protein n=3 Tax=Bergeyella zoohelcum TaxID=1015 RepID=K1MDG4_9FLAO|nr:hypothetical protein [Bergeyella zoohelcum]EKB54124.1 hypothetical protein HMPREF9699_02107 [Bergeyella zoohelcum ATCC 43767]SUV65496.1 Uncharacterised protein [Bergeyella zoohelcum]VDH06599.1 Uncharacterised protein [Bergeyella zoohelcum]
MAIDEVVRNLVAFNNKTLIDTDREVERIKVGLNHFREEFIGETERRVKEVIPEIPSEIVLQTRLHSSDKLSVDNLNKRLNISKYSVYMFVAGVVSMLVAIYFSFKSHSKSLQQVKMEHIKELEASGMILIKKESYDLCGDVIRWLKNNPKKDEEFRNWTEKNKRE